MTGRGRDLRAPEEKMVDELVYLSLGEGRHVDEVRFSVLTAARFLAPGCGWTIVLYTDRPERFAGLPVEFREVDGARAREWAGPWDYVYRGKILCLADALGGAGTRRAAIVDGDTYFVRPPAELFARLAPGRAVVHVLEGPPEKPEVRALRSTLARGPVVDRDGRSWGITDREQMWNSGVVGLDRADAELCDEALHLTDQLLELGFNELSHTAEMVAFGVCLSRRTRLGECFDVVVHYWPEEFRVPFLAELRAAWTELDGDPDGQFDRLWRVRPQEGPKRRVKFVVKRMARKVGISL